MIASIFFIVAFLAGGFERGRLPDPGYSIDAYRAFEAPKKRRPYGSARTGRKARCRAAGTPTASE
jgi:hypothetical protein